MRRGLLVADPALNYLFITTKSKIIFALTRFHLIWNTVAELYRARMILQTDKNPLFLATALNQ